MLLDDVDFSNRLRCALIVRVEERKLLEVFCCYYTIVVDIGIFSYE